MIESILNPGGISAVTLIFCQSPFFSGVCSATGSRVNLLITKMPKTTVQERGVSSRKTSLFYVNPNNLPSGVQNSQVDKLRVSGPDWSTMKILE